MPQSMSATCLNLFFETPGSKWNQVNVQILCCFCLATAWLEILVNSAEFGQNFLKMQPIDMKEQDLAPGAYKVPNPSRGAFCNKTVHNSCAKRAQKPVKRAQKQTGNLGFFLFLPPNKWQARAISSVFSRNGLVPK